MADKLKFVMCNDMLLCEVVEIENMVGGIFIPETAIDKWRMEAIVLEVSPKLDNMLDDYKSGDRVVYHGGSHVFPLRIDEKNYIIFHKKFVACKVIGQDIDTAMKNYESSIKKINEEWSIKEEKERNKLHG